MDNYLDKFYELLNKGYSIDSIAENIYLNYSAFCDNDLIYKIKRKISEIYMCDLNDIKLIGSSHTGFSVDTDELNLKKEPKDYDFAIINPSVFIRYFHKTKRNKIYPYQNRRAFEYNLLNGKIHTLYETKEIINELKRNNKIIEQELGLTKHLSICFYLSEKSFINGLVDYFSNVYTTYLRKLAKEGQEINEVEDFALKTINNLNGGNINE